MTLQHLTGRRIRLKAMPYDPNPIPMDTEGTVLGVNEHPRLGFIQIMVQWDNGSKLMLTLPPDKYEVIE